MNEIKIASVYCRKNIFIVGSNHRTKVGVWIEPGPFNICAKDRDPAELGELVISAIRKSEFEVPHPTTWKDFTKPLLDAAGVKSYSSFLKGTRLCTVELTADYSMVPYRNHGAKGDDRGFSEFREERESISNNASSEQIGLKILAVLQKCK